MNRPISVSLVAGVALAVVLVVPVAAHAELVASDPADRSVLTTPPTTITLTFSEALDAAKSSFKVVGPGGVIATGKVGGDPLTMLLTGLTLGPGDYQVQWTSAAQDGHIDRGTFTFTVSSAPAAPTSGASAAPASAAAPASPPVPVPSPIPSAIPADVASSSPSDVVLPIALALVVVAGVGVAVLRRSRHA